MASQPLAANEPAHAGGRCGCRKHASAGDDAAAMLQRVLDSPGLIARQWDQPHAIRGFEIVAAPGQLLSSLPQQGDVLIRIIEGGGGHAAVVASPGLWHAEHLGDQRLRADTESADGYVHVTNRGSSPLDFSERHARGITDYTGRLLEDLLLLRLVTQPPAVVRVEQPAPVMAPQSPPKSTKTSDDDLSTLDLSSIVGEFGENVEPGEDLAGDFAAGWREETEEGLGKKLKSLSFLPHSVEVNGKDVPLTPTAMDPGIYDGADKYKIAPKLQECLDAIISRNKKKFGHIKIALVDLTKDPSQPEFAGHDHSDQVFAASVPKVAALLAAFQLRHDLNLALKKKASKSIADLFNDVRDDWAATQADPGGKPTPFTSRISLRGKLVLVDGGKLSLSDPRSPKLERIFPTPASGVPAFLDFTSTGQNKDELEKLINDFASKDKKKHADATKALQALGFRERLRIVGGGFVPASNFVMSTVVHDLGYPYIASTLIQSGLYDPQRGGGLWLGADYFGTVWMAAPAGGTAQSATAGSLAVLMTLLVRNLLVDSSSSLEFQGLLQKEPNLTHPTIVSFFKNGLKTLPDEGSLVRVLSKVGVHEGDDDFAFIEREVGSGADKKTLRYVAIGLRANSSAELKALILELDKCILKNNGMTALQGGHASEDIGLSEAEESVEADYAAERVRSRAVAEDVGVIGADDRVRITPTTDAPWRWMCHLALQDARGRAEGHGSGVLITDRHILTAAHVVWDAAKDSQLHFVQVRPGLDYDTEPFDSWSTARIRICPRFDPNDAANQEWDYALITLDKAIGKMTFKSIRNQQLRYWGAADFAGRFTMGPGDPRTLVNTDALTAGYRGSKAYGKELWLAKGRIRSVSTNRWPNSMFTTADTTQGQSGSPMWIKEGDVFRMVGVVVDAGTGANIVRRITPGMMAELRKWITEDKETAWMQAGETADALDEFAATPPVDAAWRVAPEDELACEHIGASQLSWPDASDEQRDFMRRVYLRQVRAACQSRQFVADLPDSELARVEGDERLRRSAAANCRSLLSAARAAIPLDPAAAGVTSIEIASGYRSARRQLANWNRNFPRYYQETQTDRAAAAGGEFGDAAAALLTRYISRRLAAPGFSLHNDGRAADFRTVEGGKTMGVDTNARNRANWRASWFFGWLVANAATYGFFQNTSIDEPWHWEYRDGSAVATQSVERADIFSPDTVELTQYNGSPVIIPVELTISNGRIEQSNTALLASHRGTQPDLILRWNDMTDPATVDVVLHFHGYSSDRERMSLRRKEAYSGLDFSNPDNPSDPRPGRSAPTLCILPRGSYTGDAPGANPERYSFPALNTPSKVSNFITYALAQFQSANGISSALMAGRLMVTAHSGGGAALMQLLANNGNDQIRIDEIEIFDALYGPASPDTVRPLVSWINRRIAAEIQNWTTGKIRADSGICVVYRSGTKRQSEAIRDAIQSAISSAPVDAQPVLSAAYRVHRTGVDHGQIPRRFGWRLLADMTQSFPETGGLVEAAVAEESMSH